MTRLPKRVPRKQYNLVLICLITLSVVSAYMGLDLAADKVRASQEMISPVGDSTVIEVEKIKEVPVQVETLNSNILDMVEYIHKKESTNGKNTNPQALHNYCKSIGKSNEYGYGGMRLKMCFDSEKAAKAWVTLWLAEKLELFNGNVGMTLCYYNLGEKITNCPYAEGYAR
jgi:hypothetical protein